MHSLLESALWFILVCSISDEPLTWVRPNSSESALFSVSLFNLNQFPTLWSLQNFRRLNNLWPDLFESAVFLMFFSLHESSNKIIIIIKIHQCVRGQRVWLNSDLELVSSVLIIAGDSVLLDFSIKSKGLSCNWYTRGLKHYLPLVSGSLNL